MDEIIKILVSIIAIGLVFAVIINVMGHSKSGYMVGYCNQAIDILGEKCDFVCTLGPLNSQIGVISAPAGSVFYSKESKICYNYSQQVRCSPCMCNLTQKVFVNLTSATAMKVKDKYDYKCFIQFKEKIDINCTA